MLRQFAMRVGRAVGWRARRARGKLRVAAGFGNDEVMAFWREHGAEWAREEASPDDLDRIAGFLDSVKGLSDREAAAKLATLFRQVWNAGFSSPEEAWGWEEMGDRLPDAALLAFARGAGEESGLRRGGG